MREYLTPAESVRMKRRWDLVVGGAFGLLSAAGLTAFIAYEAGDHGVIAGLTLVGVVLLAVIIFAQRKADSYAPLKILPMQPEPKATIRQRARPAGQGVTAERFETEQV